MIRLLIKNGADVNVKDKAGRTPIYMAAKYNRHEAVKVLLSLRADPFIKCNKKLRADDVAVDENIRIVLRKGKMF